MTEILMPKATAVWLVDNTSLTFDQIADFCGLHPLEVKGIADGDVAVGVRGADPISNGQLTREEIEKAENNSDYRMTLTKPKYADLHTPAKRRGPRYTPLSKRQDRPASILWLVKFHPDRALQRGLSAVRALTCPSRLIKPTTLRNLCNTCWLVQSFFCRSLA